MNLIYNESPFYYKRFKTREVKVGSIGVGGNNPIRIQSMTTSDTCDTESTVKQILDLENAGCEIVRLTVPSAKDADNLPNIRKKLKEFNSKVPIVADIHFTPSVALKAVEWVEKIRVNPGNFADKKKFAIKEYSDKEYSEELERISEIFSPLVKRCKELGVSMRIGTNHGSLSDRIMNRYGDTPMGMVESALEFIQIAESLSFYDIIVSMKASNPQVMVHAYRLLASRFIETKRNYPLHLGVTEAGDGKDGRIKSAMGIGTLLEDGLGDTIRVSLTEDAIYEIPVAEKLVSKYNSYSENNIERESINLKEFRNPFSYSRFYSSPIPVGELRIGENYPVRVESYINTKDLEVIKKNIQKENKSNINFEIVHLKPENFEEFKIIQNFKKKENDFIPISIDITHLDIDQIFSFPEMVLNFEKISLEHSNNLMDNKEFQNFLKYLKDNEKSLEIIFNEISENIVNSIVSICKINKYSNLIFSLNINKDLIYNYRKLAFYLSDNDYPILLSSDFKNKEDCLYESSISFGSILLDGIGDIIRLKVDSEQLDEILQLSFDILQAARLRTTKTEFISCPSCGRTLFNLQDTTARIKSKTGHLKGVKIAIMGCIVNGPGEMADADFGYVGAGPGKVHLYLGKEIVEKSIPDSVADEKLIELIKQKGMWVDP